MKDITVDKEDIIERPVRVRGSRSKSTYANVYSVISNCEEILNSSDGFLSEYADINEYMSIFASAPNRLNRIAVVFNADATAANSMRAGSLADASKKWFYNKYKVVEVDVLYYWVTSKDYLNLVANWDVESLDHSEINEDINESGRVLKKIDEMLIDAFRKKASDIHFQIRQKEAVVRYRIDGELRSQRHMKPDEADAMANVIWGKLVEGQGSSYNPRKDGHSGASERRILVDGEPQEIRLRMQILPHRSHAYDMQMRFMPTLDVDQNPDLVSLGYRKDSAEVLEAGIRHSNGLILFSGQTGSGKTTSLATLIQMYMQVNTTSNGDLSKKIVTVEDPVEIVIPGVTQIQLEGKGRETLDDRVQRYAEPIRWSLRGDPDMLMVSEIRESAGANTVVSAVQSGHLCLSTVHASSTFGIFNRMASSAIGVSREIMSDRDFIRVLCNQTLVQKLCGSCKIPLSKSPSVIKDFDAKSKRFYSLVKSSLDNIDIDQSEICVRNIDGCSECNRTGVLGVRVIAETLVPNDEILNYVKLGDINEARNYWANEMKGVSIVDHALMLIEQGIIDPNRIFNTYGGLNPTNFTSGML